MRMLRASTLIGRPVLTLGGDSPFEIRDLVFDRKTGSVLGFSLRKHGFLGGPVDEQLAWTDVHGLGPDAVVVRDHDVFRTDDVSSGSGGNVLGDRVITEGGRDLGEVVEAILSTGTDAEVVGFEIEPAEELRSDDGGTVFVPLPDTIAISDENVIVPDTTRDYICDDLSGFGSAVDEFRSQLEKDH